MEEGTKGHRREQEGGRGGGFGEKGHGRREGYEIV